MAIWTKNSSAMTTSNNRVNYRVRVILNSQSIANNTSNVTVQVHVWRNNTGYTTYGTGTVYVNINGTNYSAGISSSQKFSYNSYTQVFSRTLNISHGSNGAKTLNTSARISHSQFSSSSQSYNPKLNTIPRASSLSAFSFASHLQPDTAVTINYTVDRKSSSFRHQFQLRDGSTTIKQWDNISSNGKSTLSLKASEVNTLLKRMSKSTTKSYTLRVATRSGVNGGWIGSAVSRNANATVSSTVKPSVGALSLSQTGNTVSSHYLQGKSKIAGEFTRSAGYGATITNSSITVRRKSTNNDVQTISSNSGTTSRAVSLSGAYEARGMARDSRGRTTYTAWTDFAVTAYSGPRITNFTAVRDSEAEATVNISRAGTHTPLGGSNVLSYTVQRRAGTGLWTNVSTNATGTSTTSSFSGTSTSISNSVTSSYDFRMVITDKFGESAESIVTVSTQRVVLDIHKNKGVGIGKIHERGELDVAGDAFFEGNIEMEPLPGVDRPGLRLVSRDLNGHSYVEFYGSDKLRKGYIGIPASLRGDVEIGSDNDVTIKAGRLRMNPGDGSGFYDFWHGGNVERGRNSNGDWIKFPNGVMICYMFTSSPVSVPFSAWGGMYRGFIQDTFPQIFNETPKVILEGKPGRDASMRMNSYMIDNITSSSVKAVALTDDSRTNKILERGYVAIGRWK